MNNSTHEDVFQISCDSFGTTHFVITKLMSDKLLITRIFAIVLNSILITPTILLNAIAIITILKSSQLKSKPCYFIILVQSAIDLVVGVLGIPLYLAFLIQGITGTSNCVGAFLAKYSPVLPIGISTITLSAMTMERYIAILHPYAYSTEVTKKRILVYVGSGAVVTIFAIVLSFRIQFAIMMFGALLVPLVFVFTAFAYTRIYLVVRKLNRAQNKPSNVEEVNLTRKKLFLREIKQAKSCFIVVMCFFILSFLPAIVFTSNRNTDESEFLVNNVWVYTIAMSNSSVNSAIFFWTKTMLRKEAKKRLNFICER
ncbi:histamine H2 receptor-like [Paramuricea clavata]|uniref:Histamine H2 receptor-like n=1 Tax=Paramuricea clavata TaxID=317549 RepID=A0A7D9LA85_PARCT|nr:histamine H2 receptor-like [Paramuricea clavata]